jgi:hypothetical protein
MKNTIMTTTLAACCTAILLAGSAAPGLAQTTAQQAAQQPAAARPKAEPVLAPVEIKVLRELHGVTLGMPRAQVNTALGKPMKTSAKMDEFKLDGGDMLTVRYDPLGKVRVVQFYCTPNARRSGRMSLATLRCSKSPTARSMRRKSCPQKISGSRCFRASPAR